MVARKPKGFTLIELLVVIAIIALLVAILLPSLNRAKQLAKRAVCSASVKDIYTAMALYSGDRGLGHLPFVPVPATGAHTWNFPIGMKRDTPIIPATPDPKKDPTPITNPRGHNVSENFWWLLRTGFEDKVDLFICPESDDTPDPIAGDGDPERSSFTDFWDFTPDAEDVSNKHKHLSYGLQNPYGKNRPLSLSAPNGVAWLADSNPYVDQPPGRYTGMVQSADVVDWASSDDMELKREAGNSPNHGRDGQNVGYSDGSVAWKDTANVGLDLDNIYSAADDEDSSQQGTAEAASQNNPVDSFILP